VSGIGDDVSDDQFDWRRAWAEARAKRVANAPRRAALREAFEATKPLRGQPAEQIRTRLRREAAAHGIADLTPRQLDLLVEAVVTSPRRTILRATARQLKAVRQVFSEPEAHLMPTWTLPPDGTASLRWRPDQVDVPTTAELDPNAAEVIARLFREVPREWGSPHETAEDLNRDFLCWLSAEPGDTAAGTLTVHVGEQMIGRIPAVNAKPVRQMMVGHRVPTLAVHAVVVGEDPSTGRIELHLPDRP
jgi:hypothetical protein